MDVLHQNKSVRVIDILTGPVYASCDVIFLQEVSAMVRDFENDPNIKENTTFCLRRSWTGNEIRTA